MDKVQLACVSAAAPRPPVLFYLRAALSVVLMCNLTTRRDQWLQYRWVDTGGWEVWGWGRLKTAIIQLQIT